MSVTALSIASASPSGQVDTGPDSFTFLVFALSDADRRGLLSDDLIETLSDYVIESLIIPYTFETADEVKTGCPLRGRVRLSCLLES